MKKLAVFGFCIQHLTFNVFANPDIPPLPLPISNNAVTSVQVKHKSYLLSFNGLLAPKDHKAVSNRAFMLEVGEDTWQQIDDVPIQQPIGKLTGRLASVATSIGSKAYLFGGYTVAEDHSEVSVPDVYAFDVIEKQYQRLASMPIPVDDSVALTYNQRYIYLISGWHNDGNVNLVQVYDIKTDSWQQASPFPGKPVFGQAAAIVGKKILLCDGVRIDVHNNKRRTYAAEPACYLGNINENNHTRIDWRKVDHPTGTARYRMAAMGDLARNSAYFVGGSDNPYNYNGIGYNGQPSLPDNKIWQYDFTLSKWHVFNSAAATMDHRALVLLNNQLLTVGGMLADQQVTDNVINHTQLTP